MDNLYPPLLKKYILDTTTPEPLLLKNLALETAHSVGLTQMITGPVEGKFLQLLIKLKSAKKCLEIGTFTGYSALYMAQGLPPDGKLITCEINEVHAKLAQHYFDKSPNGHKIELRLGEAMQTLAHLDENETFDFIFLDADQKNYPQYYEKLISLLTPGGILVADNALWKTKVIQEEKDQTTQAIDKFNHLAREDKRVETVMLPIRDGLFLIRKLL